LASCYAIIVVSASRSTNPGLLPASGSSR